MRLSFILWNIFVFKITDCLCFLLWKPTTMDFTDNHYFIAHNWSNIISSHLTSTLSLSDYKEFFIVMCSSIIQYCYGQGENPRNNFLFANAIVLFSVCAWSYWWANFSMNALKEGWKPIKGDDYPLQNNHDKIPIFPKQTHIVVGVCFQLPLSGSKCEFPKQWLWNTKEYLKCIWKKFIHPLKTYSKWIFYQFYQFHL